MIKRIKKLMDAKNLTATQFSEEIGIQRSSLSHVLSGRNKPSLDFMLKIKSRFPDTNLDWLLLGTGEMLVIEKSDSEAELDPEFEFETDTKEPLEVREEEKTVVRSENTPAYVKKVAGNVRSPEQVILLYADETFTVYKTKG